jgi:predicted transglutaminase-like cysteine proteinase
MQSKLSHYFGIATACLFGLILSACSTTTPEMSTPLALGMPTPAPAGYATLCQTTPAECPESRAGLQQAAYTVPAARTGLSPQQWQLLNAVNRKVNEQVRYETDEERFGQPDVWALASTVGDCEDYALTKRQLLWAAGWRTGDLSMALVESPSTGPHAVLVANTTQGAYVLDNASPWVMPWKETDYTWISAQDADGTWRVAGDNARAMLVAAAIASHQNAAPASFQVASSGTAAPAPTPGGSGGEVPDVRAAEPGGR